MKRRQRNVVMFLVTSALFLSATIAYAQQEKILHEYFSTPTNLSGLRVEDASGAGGEPPRTRARAPGEAPPLTLDVRKNEPVMGKNGPMSAIPMKDTQGGLDPASAANKLDADTDRVDELNYFSSFDPSVIPYKRGVSQNRVKFAGGDYAFVVDTGSFRALRVEGGKKRSVEDEFWGTFLLKSSAGARTPIPSVAATQRILEVVTEPPTAYTIEKDEADNYYITLEGSGLVRVNVRIAAPRDYFDGEFSRTASWRALDRSKVAKIPSEAYPVAAEVLRELGVSQGSHSAHAALIELVEHFRDFEGKPFPPELEGDDLYRSIATNQIGVCRHRSFAFVITASALGIPSRYVYNEAHAFVEVHWPGVGWRRIDLGGAAQDVLMRASDEQRRVHDGGVNDTLPSPPAYQQELDRLAAQDRQRNESAGVSEVDGAGSGDNGGFETEDGPQSEGEGGDRFSEMSEENGGSDAFEQPPEDVRSRTLPQISKVTPADLRRGEVFTIEGMLTDLQGNPVRNQEVKIILASPTSRGVRGITLGEATTGMNGRFAGEYTLPADLPIGRWALRVLYSGSSEFGPSTSE